MEVVGGVAASLQLLLNFQKTAFEIIDIYRGIRDVDDRTRSLQHDLEALQDVLFLFTNVLKQVEARERHRPSSADDAAVWDGKPLAALLKNAEETFLKLRNIFEVIAKKRRFSAQLQKYLRTRSHENTVQELKGRLVLYVQLLHTSLNMISV